MASSLYIANLVQKVTIFACFVYGCKFNELRLCYKERLQIDMCDLNPNCLSEISFQKGNSEVGSIQEPP